MSNTYESMEALSMVAETLDNLFHALTIPMPPSIHIDQMKRQLPELRDKLRAIYVAETGDNPWTDAP